MNLIKKIAKWTGIGLFALLLFATIAPLFVPITPLEDLRTPRSLAQADSQFVTMPFEGTDGIDIHYFADEASAEDEPTFVLLHGGLYNAFTWNEVFDFFDEQGRVIAYDQIPYGLSEKLVEGDWTGRNPYSGDAAVEQLITLLDKLGVEKAILVGNSFGSVLALHTTLTHSNRVEALILADAAVYAQGHIPAWVVKLPQVQTLGLLIGRTMGASESFVRQTYYDPSAIDDARLRLTLIHTEVAGWDQAMWEYLQEWALSPIEMADTLNGISKPALVLTGDNDTVVPVADSERLANTLPNAEYVVLPSCGHVPQEECPAKFKDSIAKWLIRPDK